MVRQLLTLILLITTFTSSAATVEGFRLSHSEQKTRLVVDLDNQADYSSFTLSNPERLVIDLKNSKPSSNIALPDVTDSPIRGIRHAIWKNQTLRIVLDLQHAIAHNIHTLSPESGYSHRLVIDLQDPAATTTENEATKTPEKALSEAETTAIKAEATPVVTESRVIKTTRSVPKRDIVIAIDAGHGGQDSGALGSRGTKEKDVVLAIAKRLATLVEQEPGMRPYMTRDKDVFVSLRQRIVRARDSGADMFISIHADAFTNKRAKGASVYVLSERGASSEAAQILADRENAADLAGGISLEDKDDLLASVLLDLSQTASLEASLEVGNTVLSGLQRVGHVHKKHVESAAFVVLKSPDIPSVLVETAFISNPDEEVKLRSPSHQNKLAHAIMSGIRNYFQRNPLPGTALPQQHIVSRGDTLSTIAQRYRVSMAELKSNNNLTDSSLRVGDVLMIP